MDKDPYSENRQRETTSKPLGSCGLRVVIYWNLEKTSLEIWSRGQGSFQQTNNRNRHLPKLRALKL